MPTKTARRKRIKYIVRRKISGSSKLPRLSVFRSLKYIYCQLIDDVNGKTLVAASSREKGISKKGTKTEQAVAVGKLLGEKAKAQKIERIVFDRGGYLYHGRVKALADGAREAGLIF
jgi:large subunit ribosomal protein L18